MTAPTFVLLLGGDDGEPVVDTAPPPSAPWRIDGPTVVVAADSGAARAAALGLAVDHLVGDLDSVDPVVLALIEAAGAVVHRHAADKDATDAELAIDLVVDLVADLDRDGGAATDEPNGRPALVVIGTVVGRLDHLLADLLLLTGPALADLEVTAHLGDATVTVLRSDAPRSLVGTPGEQVSILPLHGAVDGVTTHGLRWPLLDATLRPGTTRGVSNEFVGTAATVSITAGVAAVVQQGIVAPAPADRVGPYDPTPTA
jgi:thiamine pyrophosphokinase